MKITKTSDTFVSESALFKHLQNMEENTWTERTVYITSDSLSGSSSTPTLSGAAIKTVIENLGPSESGFVIFRRDEYVEVVEPPMQIPMDAIMQDQDILMLEDIFQEKPTVGVVLLRLGRFAVGVLSRGSLIASKTEGRYVKNRHKAGGSSQRRFERSRERLVRELYDKTCETMENVFTPHAEDISRIFLGGEKHTLNAFAKRCGYLSNFNEKISSRNLNVVEPNQKALEEISKDVFSSRVMTFELST